MLRVAVTGGIASGKTLVCRLFTDWGVPIVDADIIARQLVEPGKPALAKIVEHFGPTMLDDQGNLQRAALRARIFADPGEKRVLDAIMHPLIYDEITARLDALQTDYALVVVPLLLETGQVRRFDRVLVIDCPRSLQMERVMQRDGIDASQASAILNTQASREQRLAVADDVIVNTCTMDHLAEQVKNLHNFYLYLATTRKSTA